MMAAHLSSEVTIANTRTQWLEELLLSFYSNQSAHVIQSVW